MPSADHTSADGVPAANISDDSTLSSYASPTTSTSADNPETTSLAPVQASASQLECLPQEILLRVNNLLLFRSASRLARTSKKLHGLLNTELYKLAGRYDHWYPLYVAAATSDIGLFERCVESGAVIDCHWPLNSTLAFGHGQRLFLTMGWRPLRQAISSRQVDAVNWLLDHGADPDETLAEAVLLTYRQPPLEYAFNRGYGCLGNMRCSRRILFALLDAGARLDYIEPGPADEIQTMRDDDSYMSLYWLI
ncbi:hypothetical protein FBEOM_13656 [Fusarium beomiforme]|uniref:F-box domain-containing protein n=1 Tax=Fusarium beomiforme TaxID=44412 RepID=A0A9P5DN91_9HYPO|nr:hypothetical protein FBEOM_13656 [Fusarium beomiforme]